MGQLSDRLGRRAVLLAMAAASMACSFVFGWLVAAPIAIVAAVGAVYFFTAIGDSAVLRSEEHTSELQSLMRISYAVFCLKQKKTRKDLNKLILLDNSI